MTRTREEILNAATIVRDREGHEYAKVECWKCAGSGRYPSSMDPPGRCRACYPNMGVEYVPVDRYVRRVQARDRRDARRAAEAEKWAAGAAERLRAQKERDHEVALKWNEKRDQWAAERAARKHVGEVGERLRDLPVTVESIREIGVNQYGPRLLVRMLTDEGDVLVWWTGVNRSVGVLRDWAHRHDVLTSIERRPREDEPRPRARLTATVKKHDEYRGEAQTVVTRCRIEIEEG